MQQWIDLAERLSRVTSPPAETTLPRAGTARSAAVHEAGHVVVGEVVGWPSDGATIDRTVTGGYLGLTWHTPSRSYPIEPPPDPLQAPVFTGSPERTQILFMAALRYAGRQAEFLNEGVDPRGWLCEDTHDDRMAEYFLSIGFGTWWQSTAPRYGCQLLARRILMKHWRQVRLIAMQLLLHKTIDAKQISQCLLEDRTEPAAGVHPTYVDPTAAARALHSFPGPGARRRVIAPTGGRKPPLSIQSERDAVAPLLEDAV